MTCRVPADVIIPIVKRYLDSYETNGVSGGWAKRAGVVKSSATRILAIEAGLNAGTLDNYLLGRTKNINFYTVDSLLCAMGQEWRWHQEPLLSFYLSADLSIPVEDDVVPPQGRCRNGHLRTLKNTEYRRDGYIRCKECARGWDLKHRSVAA